MSKKQSKSAAAAAPKGKDKKAAKKPGVIATLMSLLTAAKKTNKPRTAQELTDALAKAFPDREASGMAVTVRAQLSRLPSEKDFDIVKLRGEDDAKVRYMAQRSRKTTGALRRPCSLASRYAC
jgi:hypothetical protein